MKAVGVFGVWNLILLIPTVIFLIVALVRRDYWLTAYLIVIGISELLMGFTGVTKSR